MKIDDANLLAYVDGELPAHECARVEEAIRESAEIAGRVSMLRASQLPYGVAFGQQALPPVPASLSRHVDELVRTHLAGKANVHRLKPRAHVLHRLHWPRLSWPTVAAAFAAGVFCCGVAVRVAPLVGGNRSFIAASDGSGMAMWIKAAAGYQQLYSRDTIALLQPDSRVTSETVAEIHDVDQLPMQIPDLRSQGLTFKRIQRLRFHDRPLVQIVYLPEKGKPVALCVLKEAKADAAPASDNIDGMAVVAWRRGQLGYALIGEPGAVDLDALGKQLYGDQAPATTGDAAGKNAEESLQKSVQKSADASRHAPSRTQRA